MSELSTNPLPGVPRVKVLDENGNTCFTGYYVYHEKINPCRAMGGVPTQDQVQHIVVHENQGDWGMENKMVLTEVTPPHTIEVIEPAWWWANNG